MKYFTLLSSYNQPGNKLHRAVLELLKSKSNLLIDDVDVFIDDLGKRICELNSEHSLCKPLNLSDSRKYDRDGSINIWIGAAYTVSFTLHPVKEAAK